MISQKELKEIAAFWTDAGDAFSLYFEPSIPSDLSRRDESIVAKERIQQAIGNLQSVPSASRGIAQRAIETIADMDGNHRHTKVIFASARSGIWREYDFAGKFGVRVEVGNAFAIAPLVKQQENQPRYGIFVANRNHGRILVLQAGEFIDHSDAAPLEKVRTTGAKKSSQVERQKEDAVHMQLARTADRLLHLFERRAFDGLLIGCREEFWHEIGAALPSELKRATIGRFHIDPGLASEKEIRDKAEKAIAVHDREELRFLTERAMGGAEPGSLGAVGLSDVVQALERSEARILLWPDPRAWFGLSASLCPNCGHLDLKQPKKCPLCASELHKFVRADEALVRKALAEDVEIRALRHASLHPEDEIGAWLRFRAEHSAQQALAS